MRDKHPTGLTLAPETEDVLWSVRTGLDVYLVVKTGRETRPYDVHKVAHNGIEFLGEANTQYAALGLIKTDTEQ